VTASICGPGNWLLIRIPCARDRDQNPRRISKDRDGIGTKQQCACRRTDLLLHAERVDVAAGDGPREEPVRVLAGRQQRQHAEEEEAQEPSATVAAARHSPARTDKQMDAARRRTSTVLWRAGWVVGRPPTRVVTVGGIPRLLEKPKDLFGEGRRCRAAQRGRRF
jgi:hypothetical protein